MFLDEVIIYLSWQSDANTTLCESMPLLLSEKVGIKSLAVRAAIADRATVTEARWQVICCVAMIHLVHLTPRTRDGTQPPIKIREVTTLLSSDRDVVISIRHNLKTSGSLGGFKIQTLVSS